MKETKHLVFRLLKPTSDENVSQAETIAEIPPLPNDCLESGFILPKSYRKGFSKSLFELPIEEIDEYYHDKKTFVVIGRNWEIHRFSKEKSLGFLDVFNWMRWMTIRTTCHTFFRYFLVLTMLVFLVFWTGPLNYILRKIIPIVFSLEMNIKLIACGAFRHPFSYFRNLWNWLDFVILVILNVTAFLPFDIENYRPTRYDFPILDAVVSLRILKLIQLFPLARLSFKSAFKSILLLKDLIITFLFFYLTFIIFALHSYSGIYRNRCQPPPVDWSDNATAVQNEFTYLCGNTTLAMHCPVNYTCVADRGENPDQGYTNFDNFGYAALSVFRLMFKDFWESLYNDTHKAYGSWPIIFFLTLIIFNLLFNNFIASYIAIGTAKFFRQLNAIESKNSKDQHSSNLPTIYVDDILTSEDNNQLSNVEFNVVATQPTTSSDVDETEKDENTSKILKIWNSIVDFVWGWKCCPRSNCQKQLEAFLFHRYFEWYINTIIAVILFIEIFFHHQMSPEVTTIVSYITLVIDFLYLLEVILKIIALTPKQFFASGWNKLDFFIAFLGFSALAVEFGSILLPLSSLRFLRALRYMKSWKKGSLVFKVHKVSVWMLFIVMLTLANIGTSLFHHHYIVDITHRWGLGYNFDSFLLVFRAFSGEWVESLLPLVAVADHPWLVYIYFLILIMSSYIFVVNVFLLLVHTILDTDNIFDTDHHMTTEKSPGLLSRIIGCIRRNEDTKMIIGNGEQAETNEQEPADTNGIHGDNQDHQHANSDDENPQPCCWDWLNRRTSFQPLSISNVRTSCWSSTRRKAFNWSRNSIWRNFINTIIILSCFAYLLPIPHVVIYTNYVVAVVFIFEITLQIIGEGVKTYFSSGWTLFDFSITLIHLILNVFYAQNPLRILRLVVRLEKLKAVVRALFYRKDLLLEAITITNFVWLLFAIEGSHLFSYSLACQTSEGERLPLPMCTNDTTGQNHTIFRHVVNFDYVMNGFIALLQFATFKGWIGVWQEAELSEERIVTGSFFMGFILIGAFVCLAIIVSSLIIKHNAHRKEIRIAFTLIL